MPSFGNLFASLTLESASFMSGIKAAQKELVATQKKFASVGNELVKVGAVMTVGLTAPFSALMASAMPAAVESQQALAQVNAALASMGPVAGKTTEQLQALAGQLQNTSTFDDDDILKSVTANLLTFGKVSGDTFDRAQQAAVNLSARLGQDLQSSAIQVGKALNDPVKGVTALQRVGVSFTAQQKEQIKAMTDAGNVAGAQRIILGELEKQFGGAAKAQRDATPTAAMDQAWRTFNENVGGAALKAMPAITAGLTGLLDAFNSLSPGVQTGVVAFGALAAVAGPIVGTIGTVTTLIGAALPVLAGLATALTATAIPAVISFGAVMAPVLLPLAAIAGAIALVVAAFNHWDEIKAIASRVVGYLQSFVQGANPLLLAAMGPIGGIILAIRHWDEVKAVVGRVIGYLADLYRGVKEWIGDRLNAVWDGVKAKVDAAKDWFSGLYDAVVGHSYIPDMVDEIGEHMARLDANLVAPAQAATSKAAQAFADLERDVKPILDRIFPDQAGVNAMNADRATLQRYAKQAGWSDEQTEEALRRLRNTAGGMDPNATMTGAANDPRVSIDTAGFDPNVAADAVKDAWARVAAANDNLKSSFADTFRDALGSVRNFARSIKSGDILGAIQSVLDLVGQVTNIIRGTSTAATRTYSVGGGMSLAGARAGGGPVLPNRSYLVGERGPEILRMGGKGGSIVPNEQIVGPSVVTVRVQANDYFDAKVVQVSGAVSAEQIGGYSQARNRAAQRRLG